MLLLAGCEVDASVRVDLDADGSGGTVRARVTLDAEAVAVVERGGGTLDDRVVLDDLAANGWEVEPWSHGDDGDATVRVARHFEEDAELPSVLADLTGPDGILRDGRVTRDRGFLRHRDAVSLVADLRTLDTGVASDEALAARLRAAGVDPAAVDETLGASLADALTLTVTLVGPDGEQETATLAPGERVALLVASSETRVGRLAAALGAGALAVLAAGLLLAAGRSARRARAVRGGVAPRR